MNFYELIVNSLLLQLKTWDTWDPEVFTYDRCCTETEEGIQARQRSNVPNEVLGLIDAPMYALHVCTLNSFVETGMETNIILQAHQYACLRPSVSSVCVCGFASYLYLHVHV